MRRIPLILFVFLSFICNRIYGSNLENIPTLTELGKHPRFLMLKGDEAVLLKKIDADANWKILHESIIEESDKMIQLPTHERQMEGIRLLGTSRECLRRIFYLSYAYRMTGSKRYADRCEKEMLSIAQFTDWNPSHFLDVAEMTLAMSIGYDWCYNTLSKKSKETIQTAIIEQGLKPSLKPQITDWINGTNNWNQVCNASMVYGALAVYEINKEISQQIIQRAVKSIPLAMKQYGPDGAYPEGVAYWEYGTSFNILLLDALEKTYKTDFGLSEIPGFIPSALYSQHAITPSGNPYSYADCGTKVGFNPTVFWFYSKTKNPALLFMQKQAFEKDTNKIYLNDRLLPIALIFGAGSDAALSKPQEPEELMWVGRGVAPVALMRSSWSNPKAIYLGFKAGTPSSNHAHMDIGSFFTEWEGVRWAHDLGMQNYQQAEHVGVDLWNMKQNSQRWDVFRLNNLAHNTIIINDKLQNVDGVSNLDSYTKEINLMSAKSDITSVMPYSVKKVVRSVALIDKSYVVVEDDIETSKFYTRMRWNMMTEASKITEINDITILLEEKGKQVYLKIEAPIRLKFYSTPANSHYSFDSPNIGIYSIGWEGELPLNSKSKIRVFLMPEKVIATKYLKP